jgi:hypothetical protein
MESKFQEVMLEIMVKHHQLNQQLELLRSVIDVLTMALDDKNAGRISEAELDALAERQLTILR